MKLDSEFKIGDVQISPKRNLLIVEKAELSLEPRVMDVLCYLARNATEVISREELIENIWEVEYGGDESLTRAISVLRKTFKSAGVEEGMIETIPKRGYRLTQAIETVELLPSSNYNPLGTDPIARPVSDSSNSERFLTRTKVRVVATTIVIGLGIFIGTKLFSPIVSRPQPEMTSEAHVLRLIESGHLTVDEAKSLLEILTSTGSEQVIETLETGTSRQKEALRLVAMPPTLQEGLEILKSEAKTAADWKLIAAIAIGRSSKTGVLAAKKAIALEPEDLDGFYLLTKAQIHAGDFDGARRSHAALKAIAKTPLERLKSSVLEGDLAYQTKSVEQAKIAINSLTESIKILEPLEVLPINEKAWSPMKEPRAMASEALATRGQLRLQTKEFEKMEPDLLRAVRLLETGLEKFDGRAVIDARRMLAVYHNIRAKGKHRLNQLSDHHEAHEKEIEQYRAMFEAGEKRYLDTMIFQLENLAKEYKELDEPTLAKERMQEAINRHRDFVADFPENTRVNFLKFRLLGTSGWVNGEFEETHKSLLFGLDYLKGEFLNGKNSKELKRIVPYVQYGAGLLLRFEDPPPESIYELFDKALLILDDYEATYERSEETITRRLRLRLIKGRAMRALEEPNKKVQSFAKNLFNDSDPGRYPLAKGDGLETMQMEALYLVILTETDPEEKIKLAERGRDLAISLDKRGKLPTNQQVYIEAFKRMVEVPRTQDE